VFFLLSRRGLITPESTPQPKAKKGHEIHQRGNEQASKSADNIEQNMSSGPFRATISDTEVEDSHHALLVAQNSQKTGNNWSTNSSQADPDPLSIW